MDYKNNRIQKQTTVEVVTWNVRVGLYFSESNRTPAFAERKYWKLKVVLN